MGWQRVGWLDHGEAFAVNLAVEVEGKHVGHAREVVEYRHDAYISVGAIHLILRRYAVEQ